VAERLSALFSLDVTYDGVTPDVTSPSSVALYRSGLKSDVSYLLSSPSRFSLSLSQSTLRSSMREAVTILFDISRHLAAQLLSRLLLPFAMQGDSQGLLGQLSKYVEKHPEGVRSVPVSLLCWMVSPDPNDQKVFSNPYPAVCYPFLKGEQLTSPITGISLDLLGSTVIALIAEGGSSDLNLLADAIDMSIASVDAILSFSESFSLRNNEKELWIFPLRKYGDQIRGGSRALRTLSANHLTHEVISDWNERSTQCLQNMPISKHILLDPSSSPSLYRRIYGHGIHSSFVLFPL
jgi:hypothetical protein